jgi:hypothetical protein
LLCILLSALLTRRLALFDCCTGFCCILAAAARENPEAPERRVRLRVEENVLTSFFSPKKLIQRSGNWAQLLLKVESDRESRWVVAYNVLGAKRMSTGVEASI